ncbi:MAG: PQQ-dependent sugar dehydrogenase [Salibacteraceae bacterium]
MPQRGDSIPYLVTFAAVKVSYIYYSVTRALLGLLLVFGCSSTTAPTTTGKGANLPLEKIRLPKGFSIEIFADNLKGARSMTVGSKGTLFVGTRRTGYLFAVQDTDQDGRPDKKFTLASGLNMPNGVAFKDGDLYVAEVNRILRFADIENRLKDDAPFEVLSDQFPKERHHGWKYIAFGPDDKLYVPVGAPCNICLSKDPLFATISRMNPDGSDQEIVAHGARNSVGFDWDPTTGDLWFTDNGRDMLGDDLPADELNHVTQAGQHFGYPFCHQGDLADPEFGNQRPCSDFVPPAQKLGPHVAALGMKFYRGRHFPENYRKLIFIAEHGSWNRSTPIGYRITTVDPSATGKDRYQVFAEGWLDAKEGPWGRPVDLLEWRDGSFLLSDDFAGVIYRISYQPN